MKFDPLEGVITCDCGCKIEVTASMAAKVLGGLKTLAKANAVKRNAKLPRRQPRDKEGRSIFQQIVDLPLEQRDMLVSYLKENPLPVKRPVGRPPVKPKR